MSDWYWNTEDDEFIICPYCETAVKPSYDDTYIGGDCVDCYTEGKTQVVTCDCCGKKFKITPYQSGWKYKTETVDGEMTEEEWDERYHHTYLNEEDFQMNKDLTNLKYKPELYIDSSFLGSDMDDEYIEQPEKLVKCRKQHKCVNCQKSIKVGDYAVRNTALFPGEGFISCYTCTKCIEDWLEESGRVYSEF